ncbi:MAG: hypothetical protein P1U65_11610 [Minwuia sp.]|nr:hypothetical protein [Minwuia sp.]
MRIPGIRLLPATLVAAILVLGLKVTYLVDSDGTLSPAISLPQAIAAGDPAPAEEVQLAAATPEMEKSGDEAQASPYPPDSLANRDPSTFSPPEIALLENLARRRDEIESRARALDVRENLLEATENRIDEKIATLQSLEQRIAAFVERHDAAETEQMKRLVKVYESMKPKDAARIFDKIDMEVLLDVVSGMKENKIAAVMADMTPQRAQELTIELADRKAIETVINQD